MKYLFLSFSLFLSACYVPPHKVQQEKAALSYEYENLPEPLKTYFFGLTIIYDYADLDSTQLDNLQAIAQDIEYMRVNGFDAVAIDRGWIGPEETYEDGGGYYDQRHRACEGVTMQDPDGLMWQFIQANNLLNVLDIYVRDPSQTPYQLYFQIVPPPSGQRIFTI